MGIARSTFYDLPVVRYDDTALVERMMAISDSFEAYGYRRMQAALRQQGFVVNHKKLRRLMREHDLSLADAGAIQPPLMAITTCRSSRTRRERSSPTAPTSSGSRTSPMSRSPLASSMSPSSSTPGRARS
jgi:hypothetical protein